MEAAGSSEEFVHMYKTILRHDQECHYIHISQTLASIKTFVLGCTLSCDYVLHYNVTTIFQL